MARKIAIIDYGAGNLRSAAKALAAVADGEDVVVTSSPVETRGADRIVLPGVGAFGQCAEALRGLPGMIEALEDTVVAGGRPFLGICVGMQLMATQSSEGGSHEGLGWIEGEVVPVAPADPRLKVPHMGWSAVSLQPPAGGHPMLLGIEDGGEAYFVHSFHFRPRLSRQLLATCTYGETLTAIVGRDNMIGTQFHPEKSQRYGLAFLRAFLDWTP